MIVATDDLFAVVAVNFCAKSTCNSFLKLRNYTLLCCCIIRRINSDISPKSLNRLVFTVANQQVYRVVQTEFFNIITVKLISLMPCFKPLISPFWLLRFLSIPIYRMSAWSFDTLISNFVSFSSTLLLSFTVSLSSVFNRLINLLNTSGFFTYHQV